VKVAGKTAGLAQIVAILVAMPAKLVSTAHGIVFSSLARTYAVTARVQELRQCLPARKIVDSHLMCVETEPVDRQSRVGAVLLIAGRVRTFVEISSADPLNRAARVSRIVECVHRYAEMEFVCQWNTGALAPKTVASD